MKAIKSFCLILGIGVLVTACKTDVNMNAPRAEKKAKELTIHGDTRVDNYYWLNERENPEVISYLEAENAYREEVMADTKGFQEDLYNEMIGRIKQQDESVPYKDNGYYYYVRYNEGEEYPVYCRKKDNLDAPEEVMLNANELAKGHSFYMIGGMSVSPDNKLLAYGVDTVSRRKYTVYVKNLETGELLADQIPLTSGGAVWAEDNSTLFYSRKDEVTLRQSVIYTHKLGADAQNDKLIYEEKDETFQTFVYKSKSRKYIFIGSSSTLTSEYRFIPADKPDAEFKIIQPRTRGLEYSIAHFGDYFYIVTNLDAKNFRLMRTPVGKTLKENWEEVIAHRDDVYLEGIEIFKDYLVVEERKEGLIQMRVIKWDDDSSYYIDFGEEAYAAGTSVNPDFNSKVLRYSYTSLTTPSSTYDFDMETREKTLLKEQEVIGDFNKDNYETHRIYATASDGTKIPMSIVYRKGLKLDGSNPTLIYGYGSYGITIDPSFSSVRLSLLDRGFVFAIAHIRGSEINGRAWYEDGKLLKKMNTFTDFIACSEYLIEQKYTTEDQLYAMGGSAGGLLMGAVLNMRPDLYKGVIAAVPFVDVVTTMLDESIPLTTGEYDEWGNPNDSVYYRYMLSYSPYDNVKAQDYPNILVTTGLHDSQVQYWEPAKWVAKLRDMKTDDNLLLMYCNMETGHGGASGRFERYKESAMEYAFIFKLAGIKK